MQAQEMHFFQSLPLFRASKRTAARFFWSRPKIYRWIGILRGRGDIFEEDYDIIFDGYPRSGNTFGWQMLMVSQNDAPRVKVHQHMPSFLITGIMMKKAVCLTIRRPIDAVASQIIYAPGDIKSELEQYIDFYTVLLPFRSQLLVLPYDVIIGDFTKLLALMNQRFGLELQIPSDLDHCQRETFSRIDDMWRDESGNVDVLKVGRPHQGRDPLKKNLQKEMARPEYEVLLQECDRLYDVFHREFQNELHSYGNGNRGPK
jgi:hypothetical protein